MSAEPEVEQLGFTFQSFQKEDSLEKEQRLALDLILPTLIHVWINLEAKHVALTRSFGSSDGLQLHEQRSATRGVGCC